MSGSWTVLLAFLTPIAGAGIVSLFGHRPNLREAASLIAAAVTFVLVASLAPAVLDGARPAVRLLHRRNDHQRRGVAGA